MKHIPTLRLLKEQQKEYVKEILNMSQLDKRTEGNRQLD
jgi:hypothetical protein